MATSLGSRLRGGSADSKLIESSERSDSQGNVIGDLFTVMQKVMEGVEKNTVNNPQEKNEIEFPNQKLEG